MFPSCNSRSRVISKLLPVISDSLRKFRATLNFSEARHHEERTCTNEYRSATTWKFRQETKHYDKYLKVGYRICSANREYDLKDTKADRWSQSVCRFRKHTTRVFLAFNPLDLLAEIVLCNMGANNCKGMLPTSSKKNTNAIQDETTATGAYCAWERIVSEVEEADNRWNRCDLLHLKTGTFASQRAVSNFVRF